MSQDENKRILVVDDEADVRMFLSTVLEDAGFLVTMASDGEQALDCMKKQVPDLITLDLVMPRKSGIKFMHELRRNKAWSSIPVMIITGHAHDELGKSDFSDVMEGRTVSGPRSYMEKPIKPERLVQMVHREMGLEPPAQDTADEDTQVMKQDLQKMLEGADKDTLEQMMKLLKK